MKPAALLCLVEHGSASPACFTMMWCNTTGRLWKTVSQRLISLWPIFVFLCMSLCALCGDMSYVVVVTSAFICWLPSGQTLRRVFLLVLRPAVGTGRKTGKTTRPLPPLRPTQSTQVGTERNVEPCLLFGPLIQRMCNFCTHYFCPQDPNCTRSLVPGPTSTSSRMPWLTAASLAKSMKDRKTRYLM